MFDPIYIRFTSRCCTNGQRDIDGDLPGAPSCGLLPRSPQGVCARRERRNLVARTVFESSRANVSQQHVLHNWVKALRPKCGWKFGSVRFPLIRPAATFSPKGLSPVGEKELAAPKDEILDTKNDTSV
jgi:hypothetical protein